MVKQFAKHQNAVRRNLRNQGYSMFQNPKAKPTVKSVNRKINKINKSNELKHFDELNSNSGTAIGTAGYAFALNNMAGGNTEITRVGNKISMSSLQMKYFLETGTAIITPVGVRVLIVYDRMHNNNASSFDNAPLSAANLGLLDTSVITSPTLAPRNIAYQKRYKVLYDRVHELQPTVNTAATTAIPHGLTRYVNIRLYGKECHYSAATGNVADISVGAISVFAVADTNASVLVSFGSRVIFKDM